MQAEAKKLEAESRKLGEESEAKLRPHERLALALKFIQIAVALAAITVLTLIPIAATSSALTPALAIAARAVATDVVQMPCGSCSTQPGEGKICGNSSCANPTGSSAALNRNARVDVVPWSMARR